MVLKARPPVVHHSPTASVTAPTEAALAITGALPWRQAAPVLSVLSNAGEPETRAAHEPAAPLGALLGS